MFMKWKSLTKELFDISCPRNGKIKLENSTTFHVHEVKTFSWGTLLYFMYTQWKSLTATLNDIPRPQSGKI